MKLLKLVYLCQGYHLAFRDGRSLIKEEVQAWQYGPVVSELYKAVRGYRSSPVLTVASPIGEVLHDDQKEVINAVFEAYKDYSAIQLSQITHRPGTPWSVAWEACKGQHNAVIETSRIHDYYSELTGSKQAS